MQGPPNFDGEIYVRCYLVERYVSRLKQWCGVAMRNEKRAANYRAMVVIAVLLTRLTS